MRTPSELLIYYPKQRFTAHPSNGPEVVPTRTAANKLIRAGYSVYVFKNEGPLPDNLRPYRRSYQRVPHA